MKFTVTLKVIEPEDTEEEKNETIKSNYSKLKTSVDTKILDQNKIIKNEN